MAKEIISILGQKAIAKELYCSKAIINAAIQKIKLGIADTDLMHFIFCN